MLRLIDSRRREGDEQFEASQLSDKRSCEAQKLLFSKENLRFYFTEDAQTGSVQLHLPS